MGNKLKSLFPRASKSFYEINAYATSSNPVPKRIVWDESLETDTGKKANSNRCVLSYTSYRCRLLDEDNWCTKFFTDALRYCGAIPDDSPEYVEIRVQQKKVSHRKEEKTVIEITYDDSNQRYSLPDL